jgi:uncharacterized caspase-like protein
MRPPTVPRNVEGEEDAGKRPDTPPPPVEGRRYAVLVGVTKYDSATLTDLRFPDRDIEKLAEVLLRHGYRKGDISVLTTSAGKSDPDRMPTAARIREEVARVARLCEKKDLLLVALSGHGHQSPKGPASFCPYKAESNDEKSMLPVDEVVKEMAGSAAAMKVLLVDACRDDPNGARAASGKREFGDGFESVTSATPPGLITYYSCARGERSWEIAQLGHGLFFDLLIKGLQGEADDYPDGHLTWTELVGYVQRKIPHEAKKHGVGQTPHFRGETVVEVPLAEVPVTLPPEARLVLIEQDFRKLRPGQRPGGWAFSNVTVRPEAFRDPDNGQTSEVCKALLLDSSTKVGLVESPAFRLTGNFKLICDFEMPSDGAGINLTLLGPKTLPLHVQIGSEAASKPSGMIVQHFPPRDVTPILARESPNLLEIERRGNAYGFLLNSRPVGVVAGPAAPTGPFERLQVTLGRNEPRATTPKVLLLRVQVSKRS